MPKFFNAIPCIIEDFGESPSNFWTFCTWLLKLTQAVRILRWFSRMFFHLFCDFGPKRSHQLEKILRNTAQDSCRHLAGVELAETLEALAMQRAHIQRPAKKLKELTKDLSSSCSLATEVAKNGLRMMYDDV